MNRLKNFTKTNIAKGLGYLALSIVSIFGIGFLTTLIDITIPFENLGLLDKTIMIGASFIFTGSFFLSVNFFIKAILDLLRFLIANLKAKAKGEVTNGS